MPVQVEGRGDAGMAHDLLQHLRLVARLDHQRRGGVPQIVNPETITETNASAGRQEGGTPPLDSRMTLPPGRVRSPPHIPVPRPQDAVGASSRAGHPVAAQRSQSRALAPLASLARWRKRHPGL